MSLEARLAALNLPLPLKREVDRILGLLSADKRQEEILQAAEMTCRISALVALAACRHQGLRNGPLDRVCSKLDRPSFGIWVELLRTAVALLRENKDELLRPLTEGLAAKVPKGSELEALAHLLKSARGKPAATVQEIFDAFPQYRNLVRGHGVAIDAATRERDAGPLLDGLLALWEAVPPTGGLRVTHVVRIEQTGGGDSADLLVMHGSAPTVMRARLAPEHDGLAGTVQLHREPSTWIRLSPLAAAEEASGTWQLGWLAGTVVTPVFNYQTDARGFQASTTQDEYEGVLGLKQGAEIDAGLQERLRLDPYRGLLAYEEIDHPVFFGREEETGRAVSALKEKGALVISGASGSGKSSLMRAGILPALRKPGDDGAREIASVVLIPGKRPLDALRAAIRSAGPDEPAAAAAWSRLIGELLPDPERLKADGLLHLLRGLAGKNRTVVLCVDQLEELTTNDVLPAERRAFLDAVVGAASSDVLVAMTVRSDLIGPLFEHEGFRKFHDGCVMSIGGLSSAQLDRIIREPLRGRHVEIEDGLSEAIVREVEGRPGALALLSQVLTTLWEERGSFGNRLTKAGYEAAGGVQGCVAAQAAKARGDVPEEKRVLLDALLLQLVSRGDQDTFVRRRVGLDEAAQVLGIGAAELRAIIAPFVSRRLIVLGTEAAPTSASPGAETAEVAHEALITGWPHLRELVASQAEVLDLRAMVEEGCDAWEAAGRRREFWNDDNSNLRRAEELLASGRLALPPRARQFLAASRARVRARARLQRVMIAALAILLAAAAIGFVVADKARRVADDATKAANLATEDAKGAKALVEDRNAEIAKQEKLKRAEVHGLLGQLHLAYDPRGALANGIASLRLDADRNASTWATCLEGVQYGGACLWVSPAAAMANGSIVALAFARDGSEYLAGAEGGMIATGNASVRAFTRYVAISPSATCLGFSPDGSLVASGTGEGAIWLWDVKTGGDRGKLDGHTKFVTAVAFSLDGTRLVTGSSDRTVKIWDIPRMALVRTLEGHKEDVGAVAFSPDGTRVVSASADKTARVWDVATGATIETLEGHAGPIYSAVFAPDGKRVATAAGDKTVRLCDLGGGSVRVLEGHDAPVGALAFDKSGARLATGSADATVRLWDVATGNQLMKLQGHTATVRCLAWSADGTRLVSGADDRTARVWDPESGAELHPVDGHTGIVKSVAFTPDGSRVVSASWDSTIRIWDAATGKEMRRLIGQRGGINSVAVSPDGASIASGAFDRTIRIWDLEKGSMRRELRGHQGSVMSVGYSRDGAKLASGADDGTIRVWDPVSGASVMTLETPESPLPSRPVAERPLPTIVYSVAFSPDGTRLVSGGSDRIVRIWDLETKEQVQTFLQNGAVESAVFTPSGRTVLASGGPAGAAVEWDIETSKPLGSLQGQLINAVVSSDDDRFVATGSSDRNVRITAADSTNVLGGHAGQVEAIAFSPDGRKLVSGARDNTVRLWDLSGTAEIRKVERRNPLVTTGAFSRDGTVLATADPDFVVTAWAVATGTALQTFRGHKGTVTVVEFSPDGKILATGATDHTVQLWELGTGRALRSLQGHTEAISALDFSEDGTRIATGAPDGSARVWDVGTGVEQRRFEGHDRPINGVLFVDEGTVVVRLNDETQTLKLWDLRTGSPLLRKSLLEGDAARRLRARFPVRLGESSKVCAGPAEWIAAWWQQRSHTGEGLSPRVLSMFDKWELSIAMRVDLATGEFETIPRPGPAYVGRPEASLCK